MLAAPLDGRRSQRKWPRSFPIHSSTAQPLLISPRGSSAAATAPAPVWHEEQRSVVVLLLEAEEEAGFCAWLMEHPEQEPP